MTLSIELKKILTEGQAAALLELYQCRSLARFPTEGWTVYDRLSFSMYCGYVKLPEGSAGIWPAVEEE